MTIYSYEQATEYSQSQDPTLFHNYITQSTNLTHEPCPLFDDGDDKRPRIVAIIDALLHAAQASFISNDHADGGSGASDLAKQNALTRNLEYHFENATPRHTDTELQAIAGSTLLYRNFECFENVAKLLGVEHVGDLGTLVERFKMLDSDWIKWKDVDDVLLRMQEI